MLEWRAMTEKMAKELQNDLQRLEKELEQARTEYDKARRRFEDKQREFAGVELKYKSLMQALRAFGNIQEDKPVNENEPKVHNEETDVGIAPSKEVAPVAARNAGRLKGDLSDDEQDLTAGELSGDRLREEIVAVLKEAYPHPLHYRDIWMKLTRKGYRVAGKDPAMNVIAHIQREDRVVRAEKRGTYTLSPAYVAEAEAKGKD
ncbi:MAG: hypothetical protein GXX09_04025 [Syntrophomonadaceae bacterium]|nr:hypothetical protein [Syntrophomonadaceae bacterium]